MDLPAVLRVLGPILQTMLFSRCSVFSSLLFSPHCSAMGCLYCAHYLLLDAGKSQIYILIEFIFLNTFSAISTHMGTFILDVPLSLSACRFRPARRP